MNGTLRRIKRSRKPVRYWLAGGWFAVIAALFLWQSVTYWGVIALVAEWQFNEFGVYRPALTFFAFVLVLAPVPLLFQRRRKRIATDDEDPSFEAGYGTAVRSATRFMKLLLGVALVSLGAALLSLVAMWMLPSDTGPLQRITASDTLPTQPREGLTELDGKILYSKTSAFDQNLWVVRRNMRFAPVVEEASDETAVRYFVELPPSDGAPRPDAVVRRGILKRDALPGELLRLYRYAGFRILPDHYVLFSSAEPMRWPYLVMACEFAAGCVVFLIAAAIQWLRRRRLVARAHAYDADPMNSAVTMPANPAL